MLFHINDGGIEFPVFETYKTTFCLCLYLVWVKNINNNGGYLDFHLSKIARGYNCIHAGKEESAKK